MRRFYQESWQGIPFTSFSHLSFFHLAEPKFYGSFYEELFSRYKKWEDLPAKWLENKKKDALWLSECAIKSKKKLLEIGETRPFKILSIGSGVGYMEKIIMEQLPDIELHVNEPSTVGMQWIRKLLPQDRIYIGLPPNCLSPDIKFDMIYLSAVDYGINQQDFIHLLESLRAQLEEGGEIYCLSASLLEEDSFIGSFVNGIKICFRALLHFTGVRRQQFWGWRRTREEYHHSFSSAGFNTVIDGFLEDGFGTYWIKGE